MKVKEMLTQFLQGKKNKGNDFKLIGAQPGFTPTTSPETAIV